MGETYHLLQGNKNDSGDTYRLIAFTSAFTAIVIFEIFAPRRNPAESKNKRWYSNLLLFFSSLATRYLLPFSAIGSAPFANQTGIGFFNHIQISPLLTTILVIVTLDLVIYWQHRIFHVTPFLWRFHQVHHADPDFDVSTGVRFHPIEIMLSMIIKVSVILALELLPRL